MVEDGKKYLVTTDGWFYGPDGESYRAAWGTCYLKKMQEVFGFTPSRPSTNWFLVVGSSEKQIIIAGCQIHYVIRCENRPKSKNEGKIYRDRETGVEHTAERIYFAEESAIGEPHAE
jgi:hypothetical protein